MVSLQKQSKTSKERNFTERIKTPIFLESVLAIETMIKERLTLPILYLLKTPKTRRFPDILQK